MRFSDTVAKKLVKKGFNISFPEMELIPEIHKVVCETFPSEPKTIGYIMNDPDFIGDVLDELGAK